MKKKDKTKETKMGCQKKESSIFKPPSSIPYIQSKSAVMNCVWTVSSAHPRLIPACLGSQMAYHGTKAAQSGAQAAQNGAPMAHTGSRRRAAYNEKHQNSTPCPRFQPQIEENK